MDKWKKSIGFREVKMGEVCSKWYGKVYVDYLTGHVIVYPIPFNWLVWLFREIHFFLVRVPDGAVDKAYRRGVDDGRTGFIKAVENARDAGYRRGMRDYEMNMMKLLQERDE